MLISKKISWPTVGAYLLLTLLAIILITQSSTFLTVPDDITYHLLTAQGFVRNGGLTLWENWSSLPFGRPHLYPPVLHLLLALLVKINLPAVIIIKIAVLGGILSLSWVSWWSIKKLFSPLAALFYLILLTGNFGFLNLLGQTLPASIVLIASPLLLILIKRHKTLAATILLTVLWYTHLAFPWFMVGALLVWTFFNRGHFKPTLQTVLISFLLYLPWLIHNLNHLEYLRYLGPDYSEFIQKNLVLGLPLNLLILFILALGLLFIFWRKNIATKDLTFFISLTITGLPLFFIESSRYSSSLGGISIAVIIAVCLDQVVSAYFTWPKKTMVKTVILTLGLSLILLSNYQIYYFTQLNKPHLIWQPHFLLKKLLWSKPQPLDTADFTLYSEKNLAIAKAIQQYTQPNEIILSYAQSFNQLPYPPRRRYLIAQYLAALSNRPLANLRYPELFWQRPIDYQQAKILITNTSVLDRTVSVGEQLAKTDLEKNFIQLGQTSGIIVWLNTKPQNLPTKPIRPVLPLWLTWLIIILAVTYLLKTLKKIPKALIL